MLMNISVLERIRGGDSVGYDNGIGSQIAADFIGFHGGVPHDASGPLSPAPFFTPLRIPGLIFCSICHAKI